MSFLGLLGRLLTSLGKPVLSIIISRFHALIPVSGFGYSFHSLPPPDTDPYSANRPESELARAFATVFSTSHTFSVLTVLRVWFPFLRRFVCPCFTMRDFLPDAYFLKSASKLSYITSSSSNFAAHWHGAHQRAQVCASTGRANSRREKVARHPLRPQYVHDATFHIHFHKQRDSHSSRQRCFLALSSPHSF
jgi:hypothetical protein